VNPAMQAHIIDAILVLAAVLIGFYMLAEVRYDTARQKRRERPASTEWRDDE
jgi:uncharacterized membrane protein YhfC